MSKNNIYIDYPHEHKFSEYQGQKWRHKSTHNKDIQYREFRIQTFLYESGYVPRCTRYSRSGFLEEDIKGGVLSEQEFIANSTLVSLAEALQSIHSFNLCQCMEIFDVMTLEGWYYDPCKVSSSIINGFGIDYINNLGFRIESVKTVASALNKQLEEISYMPSLIHGDVSPSNVMVALSGHIKIIDWTDCRIDVGISDISQAIHLMKLNQNQQNILLSTYEHPLNFPFFVQFQLLMHSLYDLVANFRNNKPYLEELTLFNKRLDDIMIFYDSKNLSS